jgi:hypothetical protein
VRDIAEILTDAFAWSAAKPDAALLVDALQRFADDAWANPGDPLNAMAFVLLNQGDDAVFDGAEGDARDQLQSLPGLAPHPESPDPPRPRARRARGRRLESIGVDPETLAAVGPGSAAAAAARPEKSLFARVVGFLTGAANRALPAAHAQSGGDVILGPNAALEADPLAGSTMTRVWRHMGRAFITDVSAGNFINSFVQMAIKSAVALSIGSTGGLTGTTLAVGYISSLADGFMMSVLEKLVLGFFIAAAADSLEPAAPLPLSSFINENTHTLVIEFARSVTDTQNTNEVRQYSYELFKFSDPLTTNTAEGTVVVTSTLSDAPDPSRLRFSIPLADISNGVHYFRLATVQYASAVELPLSVRRRDWSFRHQVGADAPPIMQQLLSAGSDYTNYAKAQYSLSGIREEAARIEIDIEMQQRLGGLTNRFAGQVESYDIEIADLNKKKVEVDTSLKQLETGFANTAEREITKIETLVLHSRSQVEAGTPAAFFLDPETGCESWHRADPRLRAPE